MFDMQFLFFYMLLFGLLIIMKASCSTVGIDTTPEFQENVPIRSIWADKGDDVELPCDITPPTLGDTISMVLWFKDNDGIPIYSIDARKGNLRNAVHWAVSNELGRKTYFQVADGHRGRLKLNNVKFIDQGIFRCRVDFVNSPTRNFRINLTLIENPSKPVIYDGGGVEVRGISGPFLEGYNLLLICKVFGGRPKPSVTWWQDVSKSLWGTKLECRAQSGEIGKPVIKEVPLDVYLKPAIVKIFFSEDPVLSGRPFTAKCQTWGSSPAARIIWKLGGFEIGETNILTTQRSNSTISKINILLSKDDDEKDLTCRAENPRFPGGVLEETRTVHVTHIPAATVHLAAGYSVHTLKEGDDLKLACKIQSNPLPTSIVWYKNNSSLQHNINAGILIASDTLTLRVLSMSQFGQYSCQVTNAVGVIRSAPLQIKVKYAPRCKKGYEILNITSTHLQASKLRCEVEADPADDIKFAWTHNNTRGDILPVKISRIVDRTKTISTLEYKLDTDKDFETLACWASNSVGRQKSPCIFNIARPKRPQPPMNCTFYKDFSTLMLNCFPGSDQNSTHHFILDVRESILQSQPALSRQMLLTPQRDQEAHETTHSIYKERNIMPIFQLRDLKAGHEYTIFIYAENEQGKSEPIVMRNVKLINSIDTILSRDVTFIKDLKSVMPKTNSENNIFIIGLIGVSSLILVSVGWFLSLTICKKKRRDLTDEGPDDFTTPTHKFIQNLEPKIRYSCDRRRTQRTSLYVEENRNDPDLLQQIELDG
ncbi:hemicentin-1 isoform X2 [Leptopilina boulardi]|uniref:hemicentin-1 isoform X2 n=1 Tax=Leptopilina boulardi TaxID=63433 RepID=UPI0021F59562|nr:hemicentin-1 isoform X2 [Leptopilina boulardi]